MIYNLWIPKIVKIDLSIFFLLIETDAATACWISSKIFSIHRSSELCIYFECTVHTECALLFYSREFITDWSWWVLRVSIYRARSDAMPFSQINHSFICTVCLPNYIDDPNCLFDVFHHHKKRVSFRQFN